METFSILFLLFLILSTGVHFWLSLRQKAHVASNRAEVPEAFRDSISLESHQKAADYTLAKGGIGRIELITGAIILALWTLGGGLSLLDDGIRALGTEYGLSPEWIGASFIIAFTLIGAVLDLPFEIYRVFVVEERFGFNRLTAKTMVADKFKGLLLTLILGVPLLWVVLSLMENAGSLWWLYVWLVWTGFMMLMLWAFPTFIAPLFNKFTPLDDASLRERIETLLQRCGFASKGIFVMDGSKRSAHGNAYFTGFGNNKRIVFFDTLLEGLSGDEIEAVLAHELGHFHHKHIRIRLIVTMVTALAGLALLGWLIDQPWFYSGLGVEQPSTYMALLLFMIAGPVFTFFMGPLSSWLSRKHEFQADAYAAQQTDARELIQALVKMYKENASTLTPDPLHSAFYDSHPPAPIRVQHLASLAR